MSIDTLLGAIRAGHGRPVAPLCRAALADLAVLGERHGVTTTAQLAVVLGAVAHETAGFSMVEENLRYSAERIRAVWPRRPQAARFAGRPRELANAVYGGRMGNRPGSDDGWTYRGRGLAQHTGRDAYRALDRLAPGFGFERDPDVILRRPDAALAALGAFLVDKGIPGLISDTSEAVITRVRRRWNGGLNGLAEVIALTRRAERALGATPKPLPAKPPPAMVATAAPASGKLAGTGAASAGAGAAAPGLGADPTATAALILIGLLALALAAGLAMLAHRRLARALGEARAIEAGVKPLIFKPE